MRYTGQGCPLKTFKNRIDATRQIRPPKTQEAVAGADEDRPPFFDVTTTLDSLQYVDLFPPSWRTEGLERLVRALRAASASSSRSKV